jgi:sulfoquinovosidase
MNTFSDMVLRSHPSNMPESYQLWENEETMAHLAKFVKIHVALADYKRSLMQQANTRGTPCTRPMMLHFREDPKARKDISQFMVGENILMAPVFHETDESRNVFLPGPALWTHLFSGQLFESPKEGLDLPDFPAPLGKPAVFYRNTNSCQLTEVLSQFVEEQ